MMGTFKVVVPVFLCPYWGAPWSNKPANMKFPSLLVLLVAVLALFAGTSQAAPQPQPLKLPSAASIKKAAQTLVSWLHIFMNYICVYLIMRSSEHVLLP